LRQGNEGAGDVGAVERAAEGILTMLEWIVSGGQTGADQGGERAARVCGSATGGRRPRGFLTEDRPRPDGADLYGARELPPGGSAARAVAHAQDSDATRGCGAVSTPGARATIEAGHQVSRSCRRVEQGFTRPAHSAAGFVGHKVRVRNGAGKRESRASATASGGP
jgi:Circularly permutated YpsA SLOG family